MSNVTAVPTADFATAEQVRETLTANGHEVSDRGRLSTAQIAEYNYLAGQSGLPRYMSAEKGPKTTSVTYKARNNRNVTVEVETAKVRQAARDAGLTIGDKGRIPQAVKVAFVTDTLGEYAEAVAKVASLSGK